LGSKSVADSMAEFALGKCVMVQNGNWAWSQIKDVSGNTVKEEDIKFLPIYSGNADEKTQGLCIGTENFLCINKNASEEQQKLAEDFLYWLFSSDSGKKFVTEKLDFIAPFNTFKEDETPSDPLAKDIIRWMNNDTVTTIPWNFTIFPSQTFKDNFGAALLSYAQGSKTFDQVKSLVVDEWKKESNR
jgi:raffinose/stachyose/melibiose transport system substrate-binding protein